MTRRRPSKTSTNSCPTAMYLTLMSLYLCKALPESFLLDQVHNLAFEMARIINYKVNVRLVETIEQSTLCCLHNGYLEVVEVDHDEDGEPVHFYHVARSFRDKLTSVDPRVILNYVRGSPAEVIAMSTLVHQAFSIEHVSIIEEYYCRSSEGESQSCFNLRTEEMWESIKALEDEAPKRSH
ncbi:hypothetical protein BJ165DRAFT_1410389 [Panaeolus papilionaceus]|nr:hypothetical protein BJ165DRAFT_1410389 [Panaeolus papilionaceus]